MDEERLRELTKDSQQKMNTWLEAHKDSQEQLEAYLKAQGDPHERLKAFLDRNSGKLWVNDGSVQVLSCPHVDMSESVVISD